MSESNQYVTLPPALTKQTITTLNMLASQIHGWALSKGFFDPCPECGGAGNISKKKSKSGAVVASGELCYVCQARGSARDLTTIDRKLMHLHGEVTEIFDLTRDHDPARMIGKDIDGSWCVPDKHCPEHSAVAVELADIIIRCLDTGHWLGLDIGAALAAKLAYNDGRQHRHGRRH